MIDIIILKFFWKHIKPYKWHYFVMLLAPIISSFFPFAYNYAIKLFLDAMVANPNITYEVMLQPIMIYMGAQLSLEVIWRISNVAEWRSEPYVRRSILLDTYNYTQYHSYQFFQNTHTGSISSKLKAILDGYDKFWAEMHHGLLLRIFKITVSVIALLFINFNLGLFMLSWCLTYIPVMTYLSKNLNHLTFDVMESLHGIIGKISDKFSNIFTIFAFSARKSELNSLDKFISNDFIPKQSKMYRYMFMVHLLGGILFIIAFTFLLFYMIHLRKIGAISIGDFAFVFGVSLIISSDVWEATTSLQDFSRAMGDVKSALSIIARPQDDLDCADAVDLRVTAGEIKITDLNFQYEDKKIVLNDINIHIKPGEKIGLVGYSGAGKSSLVNLLLKYFQNYQGDIIIDAQNIRGVTQDSLRNQIAVIPQDTLLFHRNLFENIAFGRPNATFEEIILAAKKAHIHEFIESLPEKYQTIVGERGVKLSGGQRQRIAIARAILKDAPILILDEATSALDSHTEKMIQDSLNFFIEDSSKTVIAIAHRLSTLKHMDKLIVIDNGNIIQEGTHEELLKDKNSIYQQLWKYQEL